MQVFGNVVGAPVSSAVSSAVHDNEPNEQNEQSPQDAPDLAELGRTMAELPMSASSVHTRDGYRPEAMLYVDEEFATTSRASREGAAATFMWKPCVRFVSSHYRFVMGSDGPLLLQVGIGCDESAGAVASPSSFVQPSAGAVAPSTALGTSA